MFFRPNLPNLLLLRTVVSSPIPMSVKKLQSVKQTVNTMAVDPPKIRKTFPETWMWENLEDIRYLTA